MSENGHRYVPEHAVPIESKKERVELGTLDLVRVHTMGVIAEIKEDGCEVEYEISDVAKQNFVKVLRILTPTFTKEQSRKLAIGNFVDIAGKVRVSCDGHVFLNALRIRKVTRDEHDSFISCAQMAENYYKKRTSDLPNGCSTNYTSSFGLKDKTGSLNRFPIGMLEASSSAENNMGVWPEDLEKLAAGISADFFAENCHFERREDEDDEEEEEDSFDAGPPQKRRKSEENGSPSFD